MSEEGYGFALRHAFLLLDCSGSMADDEQASGRPKHKRVAEMVQQLVDRLNEGPEFDDTFLTVITYDADANRRPRVADVLTGYDVRSTVYKGNQDFSIWDKFADHGHATPIGAVLAYARGKAEEWINNGTGQESRRAVIFLLSDGMNNVGPDGMDERAKIEDFNRSQEKGRIRLATVGYFQHPQGQSTEEDNGRQLLNRLPNNPDAYFESGDVDAIASYVVSTISGLG